MTSRSPKSPHLRRRTRQDWVKDPDTWRHQYPLLRREIYTARLTIDITPELRKMLRRQALAQDCTMSVLVRRLLDTHVRSQNDPNRRGECDDDLAGTSVHQETR